MIFLLSQQVAQPFVLKQPRLLHFSPHRFIESLISLTQAALLHLIPVLLPSLLVFQQFARF